MWRFRKPGSACVGGRRCVCASVELVMVVTCRWCRGTGWGEIKGYFFLHYLVRLSNWLAAHPEVSRTSSKLLGKLQDTFSWSFYTNTSGSVVAVIRSGNFRLCFSVLCQRSPRLGNPCRVARRSADHKKRSHKPILGLRL
jgi:hypothetical protein